MVGSGLTIECCGVVLSAVRDLQGSPAARIEQRGNGRTAADREAIKVARRLLARRAQRFLGVFDWTVHDGDDVLERAKPPPADD